MALVVFAGQSNALGFGMSQATLPSDYSPDPMTLIWNDGAGQFEIMTPGVNTGTPKNPQAWGPEVAFAQAFHAANPFEVLFIVKSAKGSTGLAADDGALDWSPASRGELFDLTAARVAGARQAAGGIGVDAVFLVQGEQDGFDPDAAQAYGANLTAWLDAIRQTWMGDASGHVGFAEISHAHEGFETVRAAQAMVAEADPFADAIDAGALPLQADGLHYASEGFLEIGREFYSLFDSWHEPVANPWFAWGGLDFGQLL